MTYAEGRAALKAFRSLPRSDQRAIIKGATRGQPPTDVRHREVTYNWARAWTRFAAPAQIIGGLVTVTLAFSLPGGQHAQLMRIIGFAALLGTAFTIGTLVSALRLLRAERDAQTA